jgi:hypothetical protein
MKRVLIVAPSHNVFASYLKDECVLQFDKMAVEYYSPADHELERFFDAVVQDDITKIVFLVSRTTPEKIARIRKNRKDIYVVAYHETYNLSQNAQYIEALDLLKGGSCNLVYAFDQATKFSMVVAPEESIYDAGLDGLKTLRGLVEMAKMRTQLTFTQSSVVDGKPIAWDSSLVPDALRKVVDYCIAQGAYRPFKGATAGHFACKLDDNTFLTSIRRTDFNDLPKIGLVKVVTNGPDTVIAYGAKPSVGGQSQRIVFKDHPNYDCIVHFHCPKKEGSQVPVVSQREAECGSMQCGTRTSNGLKEFGNLSAVFLDNHGPNITFHHSIDPKEVIDFIEANFDLSQKTGGFVSVLNIKDAPNSTLGDAAELLQ